MDTTINLKNITKQRLTKYGKYGDSMDNILNKIMNTYDECKCAQNE